MRKNILIYLTLSVLIINLVFHPLASYAQTPEQIAQGEIEEKAEMIYRNLNSLSMRDRKELFGKLTPELKSELWKIHLKSYLSKNPDLTDKQIKIIEDVIEFLSPKIYEISENDPNWEREVNKPLTVLMRRLQEEFPLKVAKELLKDLGGPDPAVDSVFNRIKYVPSSILDCNGNTIKKYLLLAKRKNEIKQHRQFSIIPTSSKSNEKNFAATFADPESCDCNRSSGWYDCVQGTICDDSQSPCQVRNFCGPLFLHVCNGLCVYDP